MGDEVAFFAMVVHVAHVGLPAMIHEPSQHSRPRTHPMPGLLLFGAERGCGGWRSGGG
jgi:hypothetical protein